MRLPHATDTRLLVAGVVASLALVAYLAVAFATTHATSRAAVSMGGWTPSASKLVRVSVPRRGKGRFAVEVTPAVRRGNYGALNPTLIANPPDRSRFVVGLWLRAVHPGRIGVEVDEFAPGAASIYLVETTVPVTARWHHFTFSGRVRGTWLGLGMYVYRRTSRRAPTSFAIRDVTASLSTPHG